MKSCVIDCGSSVKVDLLKRLEKYGTVTLYDGVPGSIEELVRRAEDMDIIIFAVMQFSNDMLDHLPNLKILQFMGTGVSNFVDLDYAASKGIHVQNIRGYGSNAVAEFGIAMTFALARHIPQGDREVSGGGFSQDGLEGIEIEGATVGVVGTGSIGALVAEKYAKLGAHVIACDLYENEYLKRTYGIPYHTMEEVFAASDIITLHMIVTKENERAIGKRLFDLTKENALLVNVARSELVDTADLYEALTNGKLAGAAMDVFDHEPPSADDVKLAALPNVIATPHIGSFTGKAVDNAVTMSVDAIINTLERK